MEKNFSKLTDYQSTLNFSINSDLILIKNQWTYIDKEKKRPVKKKLNKDGKLLAVAATAFFGIIPPTSAVGGGGE